MASLGSFGAALREYAPEVSDPVELDFYGEKFFVVGEIPAMIELTLTAALVGKVSAVDGDAALYEALRCALTTPARDKDTPADTDQWIRFTRLAVTHLAPSEMLTAICYRILGWQVGFPTERPSTSSDGQPTTSPNSNTSASDSPASPTSASGSADLAG
jgi:hypothetical protein